jgi:hypothetical protein
MSNIEVSDFDIRYSLFENSTFAYFVDQS